MFQRVTILSFLYVFNMLQQVICTASLPDWNQYHIKNASNPITYIFGYDVEDAKTNNVQFRSEHKYSNGSIIGSYGYLEEDGNIHLIHYVADNKGFRAKVEDSKTPHLRFSPQMLAALKSVKIFKKQQLQEQHQRPSSVNANRHGLDWMRRYHRRIWQSERRH